jgi:predicted AlkP superfamily pyrophosphatase or phosphodiesterase
MFKGSTVMPSVTPVCFATIFSGASPKVHGIQEYRKPVLEIQTFFDVMAAAGRNIAIVSINGCSIDTIFRKRDVDYFSLRTDEAVHQVTLRLIEEDRYDIIVSYQMEYDHLSHLHGPWSPEAESRLLKTAEYAEGLVAATDRHWARYNRAFLVTPDHGNHPVGPAAGTHGENIPDDMIVNHFYRLRRGEHSGESR